MESVPPILRLPDELLHRILSSACLQDHPHPLRNARLRAYKPRNSVLNISLTCSDFWRLARVFPFESVYIQAARIRTLQSRISGFSASAKIFHAYFRDDVSLRRHCRGLQINIRRMSRNDLALVEDLVRWLGNVRYLYIMGYFSGSEPMHGLDQEDRGDDG